MRERAEQRGDNRTATALTNNMDLFIARVLDERERVGVLHQPTAERPALQLQPHNGIQPHAVRPSPVFHEHEVAVRQGFVRTRDIQLWDQNERLDGVQLF